MKSNIFKYLFVASVSVSSFVSCDDYLTQVDPNEVTTGAYWKNLDETQSGVMATMAVLRNEYLLNIRYEAWRSDMGWPGYGRPVSQDAEGLSWYSQGYTGSTAGVESKWDALYTGIWRANQTIEALEALDNHGGDEARWTEQMATARFMRGLYYFYLYSSYNNGSIVLRKVTPKTTEEFNKALSPAEDVREFFRDDLKYAYANLPDCTNDNSLTKGMPAKSAAAVTLGTSYLYEHEYAEAKKLFADVIDNSAYNLKLETDISKMFTMAGEFNSESILEVSYTTDERTDIGPWDNNRMVNALGTYSSKEKGFFPPAWLINEYYNDTPDPKVAANKGLQVSLRASSMVSLVKDVVTPYYITKNAAEYGLLGGPTGQWSYGRYKKYTNHDIVENEISLQSGRNVIISRLSDVYLMYAECLLECDNDIEGALKYINAVRQRWGVVLLGPAKDGAHTYLDYDKYKTKEGIMEHLMYVERPLELSTEGHQIRWQDLKRWGLLEDDDKNIFKKHSEEIFYSHSAPGLTGLKGTALTALFPNSWVSTVNTNGDSDQKVDYEYDAAYLNYSKARHAYYPIPATSEIMNNTEIN